MILAGLLLLAIGAADLVRQFVRAPRRWIAFVAGGVVLFVLASAVDAAAAAIAALLLAAAWILLVPADGAGRAGVWAAGAVAAACALAVLVIGDRPPTGPLAEVWQPIGPFGPVSLDVVVAAAGAAVFLLESGNIVVRSALRREMGSVPSETGALQGGRLIGPLERLLVYALTLASAYTLLAAVLAAKGIVRFPEISRGETGERAEYFLVGSLASWATALGAAALVWWGAAS